MNDDICPGRLRGIKETLNSATLEHQSPIFRPDCVDAAFIVKKEMYDGNCYSVKIIQGSKFLGQIKEGKDGHCFLGSELIGSIILLLPLYKLECLMQFVNQGFLLNLVKSFSC